MLTTIWQDVRYALRVLTKNSGFMAVALLTLAVGIGASTAIFSVVNGVLLRPLPYGEPDRIVQIWETNPARIESDNPIRRMIANRLSVAYPVYEAWTEHARAFDAMAIYTGTMRVLAERDCSEYAVGTIASASLFDVLGVPALAGRTFLPEEDEIGAEPVAVLSYGFWQSRYGGSDAALGERLTFGDVQYTIVGVMPDGFYFPEPEQQFWLTLNDGEKQRGWSRSYLRGIGRMRDGVTLAEAQADMELVAQQQTPSSLDEAPLVTAFYERGIDRLSALPGVEAAAVATAPPFRGTDQVSFRLEGREDELRSLSQRVTPGYFEAMGIRLVRGRLFDERDVAGAPRVKVINETMARAFWPGEDALGKLILEGRAGEPNTVVGIVSDARYRGLDEEVEPFRYAPLAQGRRVGRGQMVVRSGGDPLALAAAARAAVWEVDGQAAVGEFESMTHLVARSVATPRFRTLLLTLLALVAVGLTIVGVYGIISYTVARSTREIAVRMALGAAHRDVVGGVLGLGGRLIAAGICVGLAAALAATRVLESYLFDVRATDPATFALAAALVALAATAAILVPATRAARVDPTVALRAE